MAQFKLNVNGTSRTVECDPEMPLLWALRDLMGLTGTKYGCGFGICGSCAVLIGREAVRSCQLTVAEVGDKKVTTIEGLGAKGMNPVQKAWIEHDVPQCGFCQAGMVITATALLQKNPRPSRGEIEEAMNLNICRCGTYPRIRKAIEAVAKGEVK